MSKQPSLSYKDAGVDIDAGEALVERIKSVAKRTARPEVMGGLVLWLIGINILHDHVVFGA